MKDVPEPCPSKFVMNTLAGKAKGLFVCASTLVKFVGDGRDPSTAQKLDSHFGGTSRPR